MENTTPNAFDGAKSRLVRFLPFGSHTSMTVFVTSALVASARISPYAQPQAYTNGTLPSFRHHSLARALPPSLSLSITEQAFAVVCFYPHAALRRNAIPTHPRTRFARVSRLGTSLSHLEPEGDRLKHQPSGFDPLTVANLERFAALFAQTFSSLFTSWIAPFWSSRCRGFLSGLYDLVSRETIRVIVLQR